MKLLAFLETCGPLPIEEVGVEFLLMLDAWIYSRLGRCMNSMVDGWNSDRVKDCARRGWRRNQGTWTVAGDS